MVENAAMGKGLLYCICLHHFYSPSYGDTKLVYGTTTASCSSYQIIFKAVGKWGRESDLSVEQDSTWVWALLGLMHLGLKTGPLCPFEVYYGHSI
jgi:hypothetical protein